MLFRRGIQQTLRLAARNNRVHEKQAKIMASEQFTFLRTPAASLGTKVALALGVTSNYNWFI